MIRLRDIKVLYREPDTMFLWGIPYGMRPGQSPRDLIDGYRRYSVPLRPGHYGTVLKDPRDSWLWLGSPGWWGHLSPVRQKAVKKFLARCGDAVPEWPNEWSVIE